MTLLFLSHSGANPARYFGPNRIFLLPDVLGPIMQDEIAVIEQENGVILPEICNAKQRARQLPPIRIPGPPIIPRASERTTP